MFIYSRYFKMKFSQVYALASASIAVVVNGQLDPRDDSTTPFQIYAYGPNIGGVPVFSSGRESFRRYDVGREPCNPHRW